MGISFDIKAEVNEELSIIPTEKYLKKLTIHRGVNEPATLNFVLSSLKADDLIAKLAPKLEGIVNPSGEVTWKTILRTGSHCRVYINEEFKGIFLVRSVKKRTTPLGFFWNVNCYGIQHFLERQNLFFHLGSEGTQSGEFSLLNAFLSDIDASKLASSPQDAIKIIIEDFLFKTLQDGLFRFSNNKTIEDYIDFAFSSFSYYDLNLVLMQNIAPMQDFNIWDAITKFKSPPFHEIWVTNGGRTISLASGDFKILSDDMEYVVYRPTPFDDLALTGSPKPNPTQAFTPGGESPLDLHFVDSSLLVCGNAILDFHVKDSDLEVNDDNGYSYYNLVLSGLGMDSNLPNQIFPPIIDLEALRFLGKRVFNAYFEGIDLANVVKGADPLYYSALTVGKSLQLKMYHWFKYNTEFHKGTITTRWIESLAEGEHLWYQAEKSPEEAGYYYINAYDLVFDVEESFVEYILHVSRGTPFNGFPLRALPAPIPTDVPVF